MKPGGASVCVSAGAAGLTWGWRQPPPWLAAAPDTLRAVLLEPPAAAVGLCRAHVGSGTVGGTRLWPWPSSAPGKGAAGKHRQVPQCLPGLCSQASFEQTSQGRSSGLVFMPATGRCGSFSPFFGVLAAQTCAFDLPERSREPGGASLCALPEHPAAASSLCSRWKPPFQTLH